MMIINLLLVVVVVIVRERRRTDIHQWIAPSQQCAFDNHALQTTQRLEPPIAVTRIFRMQHVSRPVPRPM